MAMSSRQHRTSCSRLLKTSGPDEAGDIVDMEPGAPGLHLREFRLRRPG